ncbi:hypothetical protein KUCAC02_016959, partial [Chaenocephalus aceratus]
TCSCEGAERSPGFLCNNSGQVCQQRGRLTDPCCDGAGGLSAAPARLVKTQPENGLQESLNQNFLLIISHREAQRDYSLNFPGSKTIQEVRRSKLPKTDQPQRKVFLLRFFALCVLSAW